MNVQVDTAALALLVVANSTPVVIGWILGGRWSARIDAGLTLADGAALFGSHKTWRGLVAGAAAGAAVGSFTALGAGGGAVFALLALAGDLASSFAKRRLRLQPGAQVPLLDQLPEALLPLLAFRDALGMDAGDIATTSAVFLVLDLLATWLTSRWKRVPRPPPR